MNTSLSTVVRFMASESVGVEKDPSCTKTEETTTIEDSNTEMVKKTVGAPQLCELNLPLAESIPNEHIAGEVANSHPSASVQQIAASPTTLTSGMSDVSKDNALQDSLQSIGLEQGKIEFIVEHGEKFIGKPTAVLAARLNISEEKAKLAIEKLKSIKEQQQTTDPISQRDIEVIKTFLKTYPNIDDPEDIALAHDIEIAIVKAYFESLPLSDSQKAAIGLKLNAGYSICDIANTLKLSGKKVRDFIESTFITFQGAEGQEMLGIIQNFFPEIECSNLREMIVSKNLKLQDKLCCILMEKNINDYVQLKRYFGRFEESKLFFDITSTLTIDDIYQIRGNSLDNIERLSLQLNKVETLIRNYLERYQPNSVVTEHCTNSQINQIQKIFKIFGNDRITFHMYRMIISNSFEDVIHNAELEEQAPTNVLQELLPLAFYYLKCSLPLDDITHIIANTSKITLTTHDLFHILFQLSDPVLRGYCIEHYSFSNPVPLYFPKLINPDEELKKFEICKELWYSLREFNGLVSFGLGRAGWNPIGKSYLLDFIFGTDFVRGNPQTSAFHFNSIDIQMTKNLFGEMMSVESTKWAYIDCHGHSNLDVIKVICQHLDIALIHVSYIDYSINRDAFNGDLTFLIDSIRYVFLFIRDFTESEVKVIQKEIQNQLIKTIFIPNLTKSETNIHSVMKSLEKIGHEILHLEYTNPKFIRDDFLEKLIGELDPDSLGKIQSDKRLIRKITDHIPSNTIDFSFLSYYPTFVDSMSYFYKAAFEIDQKRIDEWNTKYGQLCKKLNFTKMGDIVVKFNEIISEQNSTLILWKLSQDLSIISKKITMASMKYNPDKDIEQKNDKYTLEILWREALLSSRARIVRRQSYEYFLKPFATNYSIHVERGEPFELIDGDNLRFFNRDIDSLLSELYKNQLGELEQMNEGKSIKMKQAPIVVSIFGPQSSGKSTLLNYCFGCKFLTSAGRCTRGIYGSLSRLSRPINLSNNFLILDTEGLDALERGCIKNTSHIHFDRTMVLFCLAVSQVVIINVKGDIGSEIQNLLQVCAYSLNKLKVRKLPAPKIFFVLNQQADPDLNKHMNSINILLKKLNEESELMDTEGVKISDLIQVSKENLFILPSAFNSEQMNKNLFDSNVIKLSPTVTFADKCARLRMAIINQLDDMPVGERAPFETMSAWMKMSGTIWDTIIRYQDIVKYGNMEEEKCSNMLRGIISEIHLKYVNLFEQKFLDISKELMVEINAISTLSPLNIILTEIMKKFDEVFKGFQDDCLAEFETRCHNDSLLRIMNHICFETKSNLSRLIYIKRKIYEDKFKFQIKAVLTEIKMSEGMKKFQEKIIKNVDNYLEWTVSEQKYIFGKIWKECFEDDDQNDKETERDEIFYNLYSIFKIESKTMEIQSKIYELFREHKLMMSNIISTIEQEILLGFQKYNQNLFIYQSHNNNNPIKDMTPYPGERSYRYIDKDSLFALESEKRSWLFNKEKIKIKEWVPKNCHPLVKSCSGYYTHPEITWKVMDHNDQVLLLASKLKAPNNSKKSTWEQLVNNTSKIMQNFITQDPNISHATVKLMINSLHSLFEHVNYEINFIEAKLSNTAERTLSTLMFAYAFNSLWEIKCNKRLEDSVMKKTKKENLLQYFLRKIENRKMVRGSWDREKMRESDHKIAENFAQEFIGSVERGLKITEQPIIESIFLKQKKILCHESIFLTANSEIIKELRNNPGKEVVEENNFVTQYICNRNEVLKELFRKIWEEVEEKIFYQTVTNLKDKYNIEIGTIKQTLKELMHGLKEKCNELKIAEQKAFDSDNNFEIVAMGDKYYFNELMIETRESPFKAVVIYLRKYFDPKITPEEFDNFLTQPFVVDGVQIKISDTNILCKKTTNSTYILDEDLFKKLENTKMFNSENIFNILIYLTKFLSVLETYEHQLLRNEFKEMVQHLKEEFEKNALGCPSQCPSCGKLCERELHPNDGKCQIKTGHQICSMGGSVWNNDDERTAVLFMCDSYKDDTMVSLKFGESVKWGKFKEMCGDNWDWTLPQDEKYVTLQQDNRTNMRDIWNKFGRGILSYYSKTRGNTITYVPYSSFEEVTGSLTSIMRYTCFVIDGTGSMLREIKKACISVGQLISKYKEQAAGSKFKVVIYRDHCDDIILEKFPSGTSFTSDYKLIQYFLENVKAYGGGDYPEAVLDGLATAATKCEWENSLSVRNIIIHIFDAPPHGDFPNYESHDAKSKKKHCCCCNQGTLCNFAWKRDVWSKMKEFNIQYRGINTGNHFPEFEATMKTNLGNLCGEFQSVGKEVVNEAVLQIFVDLQID